MLPLKLIRFDATAADQNGNVYDASFTVSFPLNRIINPKDIDSTIQAAIRQFYEYHPNQGTIHSKREASVMTNPINPSA